MSEIKKIAIIGSTGSIGTQALEVIKQNPGHFAVEVLVANSNADLLMKQALEFKPNAVVIGDESKYQLVKDVLFSLVKQKVENFSEKTRSYFGLIVILIFFSTFKGIFGAFGWFIRFCAFLLYKILLILGFAYISVESRSREFILLS